MFIIYSAAVAAAAASIAANRTTTEGYKIVERDYVWLCVVVLVLVRSVFGF